MVALLQNRQGITDALQVDTYASPALIPASPWLESDAPLKPTATVTTLIGPYGPLRVHVEPAATGIAPVCWAVWLRYGTQWFFQINRSSAFTVSAHRSSDKLGGATLSGAVVSAIDRVGNESPRTTLDLSQIGLGPR